MEAPQAEKHSYANTGHVRTTHLSLHVDLDFKRRVLHGFVELSLLVRASLALFICHAIRNVFIIGTETHEHGGA